MLVTIVRIKRPPPNGGTELPSLPHLPRPTFPALAPFAPVIYLYVECVRALVISARQDHGQVPDWDETFLYSFQYGDTACVQQAWTSFALFSS